VRIDIADSGPGIMPEDRGKIFQRFYRVDKSRSGEGCGVGLGLSIAQWAVEAHGGRITIESNAGEGCTFQTEIPRDV
jgi:signal transduction histidine kinase